MGLFTRKEDEAESDAVGIKRSRNRRVAKGDAPLDPLDPLQLAKRRARRRLIGAAALVLGAVVLLPMVFDKEPKNRPDDLSVEIPSQNSSFNPPLTAPSSVTPAAVAPQNALVPGAPVSDAASNAGISAVPPPPLPAPSSASAASVPTLKSPPPTIAKTPEVKPAELKTPDKSSLKTAGGKDAPGHDDPRALAALEGKSLAPTSANEESKAEDRFAVQIGAFSNADKVKEVRDRLTAAGLKSYTENLNTAQGSRTRVRVGPFGSHEAAEAAREKIKGLGFDGSVVTL